MKNINAHIKEQNFKQVYLLYGEEAYLKRTYKNRLREALTGTDDMNYAYFEGKGMNLQEIGDQSRTLPFFADRRLLVFEDSGMFKTASEEMVDIIKEAPDTTFFIFVETETDKRNRLYKLVADQGYVCEMKNQTEDALSVWAARMFADAGKKITRDTMSRFLGYTGQEMDQIASEAEKVIGYSGSRDTITIEDLEAVCSVQTVDRVFDMINAIAMKDKDTVIRLYGDLMALKEAPMKILALIARQFTTLLAVKEMMEEGYSGQILADKLKLRSYFVGRYIAQAKSFSLKELRQAAEDCVNTEQAVKSGLTDDAYAVEMLILKYCM